MAFFLDRRVDPWRKVDLSVTGVPVDQALQMLAGRLELGVCYLDSVIYLGPPDTALRLSTLSALRKDEARRLPTQVVHQLAKRQPWRWPALSTPQELFKQLTAQSGIAFQGLEQIPHDLWPAVDLPPLTLIDRITLAAAGFGLTFQYARVGDRGQETIIRLVPFPDVRKVERLYSFRGDLRKWQDYLEERFPDARVRPARRRLALTASWEDHAVLDRLLQGSPRTTKRRQVTTKITYDLKIEDQPIGLLIRALAKKFKMQVQFDPGTNSRLTKRVTFQIKMATAEQIIQAALKEAGLIYRRSGDLIEVLPAAAPPEK